MADTILSAAISRHMARSGAGTVAPLVGLIGMAFIIKVGLATQWSLLADEAYYAIWAMQPALGYYDQPPLIAWVLSPIVALTRADWAIRVPAALAGLGATLAVLSLHRDRVFGAAWWMGCVPLAWLTGFMTPDALLLLFWAGCLAAAVRGGRFWVLAGLLGALATLSKYSGLAVFPLAWLAVRDRSRFALAGWVGWLLLLLPHGVWLALNDGVSVRFQAREGLWSPNAPGIWGPLSLIGQQVALLNPLLAGAVLWVWLRPSLAPEDRVGQIAWWTSAPIGMGFLLASPGGPPEAHWLAPCWIGAGILLARGEGRLARMAWSGVGVGLFTSVILIAHAQIGVFRIPIDPRDRLREGPMVAQGVALWALPEGVGMREEGVSDARFVYTERYQEAAFIHWYAGIPARRHPGCGRHDQYDLWPDPSPDSFLFLRPTTSGPLTCTGPVRARHPLIGQMQDGRVVGRWDLFEVGP